MMGGGGGPCRSSPIVPACSPASGLAALVGAICRRLFGDPALVEADVDALLAAYGREAEWVAKDIGAEHYHGRQFRTAGALGAWAAAPWAAWGGTIREKAADKCCPEMYQPLFGGV
jgi:hypothetical protein